MEFICKRCSKCCTNLTNIYFDNYKYPMFIGPDSSPSILYSRPSLRIMEWEKEIFNPEDIIMNNIFFDKKSQRIIALNYTLKDKICPLIKNNINIDKTRKENPIINCPVYDKRPQSCRIFPCPDLEDNEINSSHGFCPGELNNEKIKEIIKENKDLFNRYKESFILKKAYDLYKKSIMLKIKKIIINEKINLAQKNNFNLNELKDKKIITIHELLKELNEDLEYCTDNSSYYKFTKENLIK
jgi:Fe-S-cluster containining protein